MSSYSEKKELFVNIHSGQYPNPTLLRSISGFCLKKWQFVSASGKLNKNSGKRITFCTPVKASLTVEAALVLPVFLFAVLTVLQLLEMCLIQGMLQMSLQDTARTAGIYGYVLNNEEEEKEGLTGEEVLETAACIAAAQANLPDSIKERGNISLLKSRYDAPWLKLQAEYRGKVGFLFFQREIKIACRACVRVWKGESEEEWQTDPEEEMVFITENGSVYHTDISCRHLRITLRAVKKEKVAAQRNQNGEKYSACEKCVGEGDVLGTLYLTSSGNRYHNTLECSALVRKIRMVRKREVKGYPLCSDCEHG